MRAGSARHVLVIGAEKLSQWVDWTDRSTCIIFADGAGAAVVGPAVEPTGEDAEIGVGPVVWGSDGNMADKIYIKDRNSFIFQEGQAVFRWATTALHPVALKACADAGVDPTEIDVFVPHQANLRIIEALARKLGAPQAKVATDIVHGGQHLIGIDPAGAVADDRARRAVGGRQGAADRLRRGGVLRRAGDHGTLTTALTPGTRELASQLGRHEMAMTDAEILEGLSEIIDEIAGVPADEVTPDKTFVDDLDIDSLSMVEIAVAAQDKFGVEIPDDQLKDLKTVQDVINYVKSASVSA